jgi:NAD(P)-dependent dehydrogenase (short-subunit alcohol dehydrogenase family)
VRGRVAQELGRVDILVNNAAIFESATWDELGFELWQRVMRVNLNGPMLMRKAFLPLMRGRGWGRVINIASAMVTIASPVSETLRPVLQQHCVTILVLAIFLLPVPS